MQGFCTFGVFATLFAVPLAAGVADQDDYIKVEIRGTLRTGLVAIGGETTGTVIKANNVTWELDLGGSKKLQELAEKLDGKTVVVTGTYHQVKGVEIPIRHIVKVKDLKAAEGQ